MPAPTLVQLKPEPSQQEWLKVCGEDQAAKKKVCYTTRDFVSDENQPVIAVAVYDVQGEPQKVVRFLMPLGLLIQTGIRFTPDQGASQPGRYAICFPNGCFAEGAVKDDTIADILINSHEHIFVERFGQLEYTQVRFRDEAHLTELLLHLMKRPASGVVQFGLRDGGTGISTTCFEATETAESPVNGGRPVTIS